MTRRLVLCSRPAAPGSSYPRSSKNKNQEVRWVELRKPPGKKAFEMIGAHADRDIYIKFQLGAGKIKGRSFHYSTRERAVDE